MKALKQKKENRVIYITKALQMEKVEAQLKCHEAEHIKCLMKISLDIKL